MGGVAQSRILATAGLLALLVVVPAEAAQNDGWSGETEAEQIEARAAALEALGPAEFHRAAKLYRKAASLRAEGDPKAVKDLMKSGKLFYYAGDHRRSVNDLEKAADMALEWGDVLNAALGCLDAAWVAHRMGDGARAHALAVKGARLSQSPLIEAAQRDELARRVDGAFVS